MEPSNQKCQIAQEYGLLPADSQQQSSLIKMTNLMSESSSVIFYAKCGIGKLIKRWLGVEHDTVLFSSVGEAVKSAKMYYWS